MDGVYCMGWVRSIVMSLLIELQSEVNSFTSGNYTTVNKQGIPYPQDIPLGNQAAVLEATTLFVDVRQSSDITNSFRRQTAAKMMKAYFAGAVRIINQNNGQVRSFNGDGMLAIFIGASKDDHAVKAAMQLKYFVNNILEPKFRSYFANNMGALGGALNFSIGIGIDEGTIYAVRVGIKGTNDVAWIGRCTNTSAKLSGVADAIAITDSVYKKLSNTRIFSNGVHMWSGEVRQFFGGVERIIRATTYHWKIT
ncbi:adenylate/guanylate cyclase domain-containing protein [Candidatus Saccharibacteria bacterium]|nr:adenylate/guanylate cyclase domain-containing protein [Candidatus Saccharibacteria bacterium]